MSLRTLDQLIKSTGVKGKRVLVRVDLNVPMVRGVVSDDTRITALLPTINKLVKEKAKVILLSHFGRPKGEHVFDMSLAPIADALSDVMGGKEIKFAVDCIGEPAEEAVDSMKDGEILLLENLRFHKGEEKNDASFTKALAKLGDVYINDAFSCSHRSHASITGLAKALPSAAGYLLEQEIVGLEKILSKPKTPMVAIVGGSKVSTKIDLLNTLAAKVDALVIGGGMANTFLYAKGIKIGKSLCEKDYKQTALDIMAIAEEKGCEIVLPVDAIVADDITSLMCRVVKVDGIPDSQMILDMGQNTVDKIRVHLKEAKTVVWNGPLGAFEYDPFLISTASVAREVAYLTSQKEIVSVAGGGDILSALNKCGLKDEFSYISTAGGAFLEWLEGKELPGVKALAA
ncbi:MAG: phosphoglycerate kinase [Proteobacteria bacterium]|nr:phosphoglycerate kinase [Pseudomonadota bacterium]